MSRCSYSARMRRCTCRWTSGDAMRLLLIEDDAMIGAGVRAALRQDRYVVDWVQDGAAAEAALAAEAAYALLLLDLGLPKKDGLALLEGLRRRGKRIPVLIITARSEEHTSEL